MVDTWHTTVAGAWRSIGGTHRSVTGSGERRANTFAFILLGLQRLSYLGPPVVTWSAGYRMPVLNLVLLIAVVAWNAVLFGLARPRGWFAPWMVWTDVVLAWVLVVALAANTLPGPADDDLNWSSRTSQAAAALVGAVVTPLPLAAAAVASLLALHAVVSVAHLNPGEALAPELVTDLNGIFWYALIVGFLIRYLRRQGSRLDEAALHRLSEETQRAAERAGQAVRLAHHRLLHNTALATLTAIGSGGLDPDVGRVRQRCARDAERIRRLLAREHGRPANTVTQRLAEVAADAEDRGLRVRFLSYQLPDEVPHDVVEAIGDATQEAVNNVARHAGVDAVRLTAAWEEGVLTVRIVDHGRGFDAHPSDFGFGLRCSIVECLRAVGGTARVSSAPGEGTIVELRWRR